MNHSKFALFVMLLLSCHHQLDAQVSVQIDVDPAPGIQNTYFATAGESIRANIYVEAGASGLSAYGVSVEFDSLELDLAAENPVVELVAEGMSFNLSPGVIGIEEDRGDGIGHVLTFESAVIGLGPANTGPINIGWIDFVVVQPMGGANDIDIVPLIFDPVFDAFLSNNLRELEPDFFGASITTMTVALGDFNSDGLFDHDDVCELAEAIRTGSFDSRFDLTADLVVDDADLESWVHDIKKTYFGDATLDGLFDSSDLIEVFKVGQYEDGIPNNSKWQGGDWTGDGDFDTSDLILAFQDGGYERGPRPAASTVPEPRFTLFWAAFIGGIFKGMVRRISA